MKPFEALNLLWYLWKRNNWMLDPRSWFGNFEDVPIDRPIFLLGVQGGGLTLLSRMLRRHPQVVSVSGNHHYWSGADEMHTVLGPILPPELTGTCYKVPWPDHSVFKPPRSWTYACDELLPYYRKTTQDATPELKRAFERVIRMCIARHALDKRNARFVDKSQVYTVRVSFLEALLEEYNPRFVLVTTDPYSVCLKAALGYAQDMERLKERLPFEERLRICAQHWANSMRCALEDKTERMLIVRFEDVLEDPEQHIARICDHVGIQFVPEMLPQPGDKIPFGSRFRTRWYPLVPKRASRYKDNASSEHLNLIRCYCGELANKLGYAYPKSS